MIAREIIAGAFCAVGTFFFILGTTGLLRLPDVFARLHPSTKCDTLGGCSVLVGLMVHSGFTFDTLKLLLIVFFLLVSSATCGHAIGRSAFVKGIPVWKKDKEGEE